MSELLPHASDDDGDCDIAIVGGGAAGTLVALHLLQRTTRALRLQLIEPQAALAQGVAYATPCAEHVLNVPAGRMSAFAEVPDDFLDWLQQQALYPALQRAALAQAYVQRRHYAGYLRARLAQALAASPAQLQWRQQRVLALDRSERGQTLQLQGGTALRACATVLALGNSLRPLPARGAGSLPAHVRVDAWNYEQLRAIPRESTVCIVGAGQSMADSVLTLLANAHRGPVHVISRHALLPLPHAEHAGHAAADFDPQPLLALPLRQRLHALRRHAAAAQARGLPWQSVMERLRPLDQALWQSLSATEQRRFLRHAVRHWDAHRHRIAAPVFAQLQAMRRVGQLRVHRARLDTVFPVGACVQVNAVGPDGLALQLDAHCVINATGVELRAQTMRNPLLLQLLGCGHAVPGAHGIGVATDADGALLDADGRADPRLRVLGSLRIGSLWESLAIPELRVQAQQQAQALLAL
ncbi:pyridine nucleotide-disulfide oxidoreductase [Xanthomonas cerealis pv. cerealis]|uniref:Pyridine nucleotide-disulfide oxidoreductase n=1 Tax=Xanthomonas cerealis pv. cerealis TaxID=152263 RepID=A0A514EGC3_9XANT|nr:FAD/NAD(P)-binding protein [Xanthomonas translucens]QDI05074.1 pyridine nucleotide-disulfide oxidoreductase [Xanthomonas translucens pv. cerealis]